MVKKFKTKILAKKVIKNKKLLPEIKQGFLSDAADVKFKVKNVCKVKGDKISCCLI